MFAHIPDPILNRMRVLEAIDARDRVDGTPKLKRMRQIPAETGRFLAILLANAPAGVALEIGTSAGYSCLWLSLACKIRGDQLTTIEVLPEKVALARETFTASGTEELINLIEADARLLLSNYAGIAFCFLDAEKNIYQEIYEQVVPKLVPGGILAADNAVSHPELQSFNQHALSDPRLDAVVVPIGKGVLVGRKA